ncbi:MAG: LysE family transporter [Deltaproteobacteria bacterium]|nr:LysE family transporter [Deltaproteobacteria bacterium]
MLLAALVGFVAAFIASMPVAGPVAALIVRHALEGRTRSAVMIALGTGLAEGLYALLALWGFATVLDDAPAIIPISKAVAAVILIALGIVFARFVPTTPGVEKSPAPPPGTPHAGEGKRHHTIESLDVQAVMKKSRSTEERPLKSFSVGFTVTVLNPTLLATWAAAATTVASMDLFPVDAAHAPPFAIGVTLGACGWFGVLIWLLSRYRHRFSPLTLQRVIRGMGWGLVGLGLWFLVAFIIWFANG